ncbi:Uncharacterized protein HZ326_28952 [Fusarium oxysporum f. sp. albedinis]|nr:Uncharacterized protein HZ326_28952 [Fusarium oxysporum f. sp. albedinis]
MKNSLAASAGLKAQHIFLTSYPSQLTRVDMLSSTIGSALYQEATVLIEEKRVQSNMKGKIKPHVKPLGFYSLNLPHHASRHSLA